MICDHVLDLPYIFIETKFNCKGRRRIYGEFNMQVENKFVQEDTQFPINNLYLREVCRE
jgi:hypothetical protein